MLPSPSRRGRERASSVPPARRSPEKETPAEPARNSENPSATTAIPTTVAAATDRTRFVVARRRSSRSRTALAAARRARLSRSRSGSGAVPRPAIRAPSVARSIGERGPRQPHQRPHAIPQPRGRGLQGVLGQPLPGAAERDLPPAVVAVQQVGFEPVRRSPRQLARDVDGGVALGVVNAL